MPRLVVLVRIYPLTAAAAAAAAPETSNPRSHDQFPNSTNASQSQPFRLPPASAEIAERDSDPDINDVNHLLARLAQVVRWYHGAPNNPKVTIPSTNTSMSAGAKSNSSADQPMITRRKSQFDARLLVSKSTGPDLFADTPQSSNPEKQTEIEKILNGMARVEEQLKLGSALE